MADEHGPGVPSPLRLLQPEVMVTLLLGDCNRRSIGRPMISFGPVGVPRYFGGAPRVSSSPSSPIPYRVRRVYGIPSDRVSAWSLLLERVGNRSCGAVIAAAREAAAGVS